MEPTKGKKLGFLSPPSQSFSEKCASPEITEDTSNSEEASLIKKKQKSQCVYCSRSFDPANNPRGSCSQAPNECLSMYRQGKSLQTNYA